ncbi:DUF5590 domain-containing protein [Paenibacillus donghaensis]|uniref:Cell wall elongation regulator TseB-like domain-containing protein n=1 Tax=Paenibacillus donghaensis TaxID=414771 RepID=A0A2Z2KFW3_9BACL|nr:DUF5590 domain-containing protein [Paenibacillus donghaensis]ASA22885.1 hypothetical protein B9T62_19990 [Paenibacillus donghaensis]
MKKRRKWILLGSVLIVLLVVGLIQFYAYIMKSQWGEQQIAEDIARTQAGLTEISKAQKSVWGEEAIYWVLTGNNAAGQELMVWVRFLPGGTAAEGENAVYGEEISKGTSEEQVRAIIKSQLPGIKVERLLPGVFNGEYVWQLFYQQEGIYHYKFFRFADGTEIGEGYNLPQQ